jgi:hypothetical protein
VCRELRGPVRAVLRARPGSEALTAPEPAAGLSTAPSSELAARAEDFEPETSRDVVLAARLAEVPRPERVYAGPLDLDLGRIVLPHRVENVPPPPDFIFRPFVSSLRRAGASPAVPASASPIEPRLCQVVDQREAGRRVARGWRVDVAPCVEVGPVSSNVEALRRVARRRLAAVRALQLATTFDAEGPAPVELDAVSA